MRLSDIKDIGLNLLDNGDRSFRGICPECGGGISVEKSFTISRVDDVILYNCYRISCGLRGSIKLRQDFAPKKSVDNKTKVRLPPAVDIKYRPFDNAFPFDATNDWLKPGPKVVYSVAYAPSLGAYWFDLEELQEIQNPFFGRSYWGVQLKKHPKENNNQWIFPPNMKCMTYWYKNPEYRLHFCASKMQLRQEKRVVLVEDVLSAEKLRLIDVPTIALLGTNVPSNLDTLLAGLGVSNIIWMLDPDTWVKGTPKAFSQAKKMLPLFQHTYIRTKKDPKDTPLEDLKEEVIWT